MKGKRIALTVVLALAFCLVVSGAAAAMSSANYDLSWTVLSGGGGDRNSANYVLGDTVGQSAIGPSESTSYRLGSGYWYGITYEAPNNPPNTPSNPSPANHATGVSINADLSWSGGDPDAGDTVTYDVYFGISATPPLVSNDQLATTYDPGALSYNNKYYWQIVATDNHGASTTGPLWDFTTLGEWNPWVYDENSDSIIQKMEALQAVQDYFGGEITKMQVLEVLQLYFAG